MLFKEVKQYSNRQRININKDDNLKPGEKVILLTANEYEDIKTDFKDLQDNLIKIENENQLLQSQEQNLKELIENVTAPIYENHKKDLENKDLEIKQLTDELNAMKQICSQFGLELMGLNSIDILFRSKHKKLIQDFNNNIWITAKPGEVVNADAKAIPGKKE